MKGVKKKLFNESSYAENLQTEIISQQISSQKIWIPNDDSSLSLINSKIWAQRKNTVIIAATIGINKCAAIMQY